MCAGQDEERKMNLKQTLNSLHRSKYDRMLGGVCAGFGESAETPAWVWRAGFLYVAL
jgi:phage shock protein PspC (stress-responsive transcriptional regulator)